MSSFSSFFSLTSQGLISIGYGPSSFGLINDALITNFYIIPLFGIYLFVSTFSSKLNV